jgi:O-glycosyl hydrolase
MMHEDLMLGNVASWQYWIAVSKYDFRDGLIYVDESTHFVIQTKRLWAFANYSRFIRPGFVRIQALSTASGLKTTAFRSEDGHSVVLVAINDGASPLSMRLPEISGLSKLEAWETSESRDLEMVLDADAPKGYDFPGRSITTLVFYEKTYMR